MKRLVVNMYKDMLLSIKRGNGVNGKSIAKPILLLSIIENISSQKLICNNLLCDDNNIKNCYARLMMAHGEQSKIPMSVPYYHLASSPFYHLIWKEKERPPFGGHTPSAKYLREHLLYANLDDELWELLQDAESREYIKQSIIRRYLTE